MEKRVDGLYLLDPFRLIRVGFDRPVEPGFDCWSMAG